MTRRLLQSIYGDQPDALDRCRAAVAAVTAHVTAVIAESRAHGRRATVAVVSRMDDTELAQTLRLVLVDGTWLIDEVQRSSAS